MRDALHSGTMVVATAVLFYVSYWLLSKMEVVKWNHFVKSKVQDALNSGSALALATDAGLFLQYSAEPGALPWELHADAMIRLLEPS